MDPQQVASLFQLHANLIQFCNLNFQRQIYENEIQKYNITQQDKLTVVSPTWNQILEQNEQIEIKKSNQQNKLTKTTKIKMAENNKVPRKQLKKKQNRNIIPNAMHQIFSFVRKQHKSGNIVSQIFQRTCPNKQWHKGRYYGYQKNLRDKINNYMKQDSLIILTGIYEPNSEVYSIQEQHYYMKVARLLAMKYIDEQSLPLLLTSRRMQSEKKIQHLKNRRQLLQKSCIIFQL